MQILKPKLPDNVHLYIDQYEQKYKVWNQKTKFPDFITKMNKTQLQILLKLQKQYQWELNVDYSKRSKTNSYSFSTLGFKEKE